MLYESVLGKVAQVSSKLVRTVYTNRVFVLSAGICRVVLSGFVALKLRLVSLVTSFPKPLSVAELELTGGRFAQSHLGFGKKILRRSNFASSRRLLVQAQDVFQKQPRAFFILRPIDPLQ